MWLLFKANNSVTEVETFGTKPVVAVLLVRVLTISFTKVAVLFAVVWSCDVETCCGVPRVSTVFDSCSSVSVTAGVLMTGLVLVNHRGLWVDECNVVERGVVSRK